MIPYYYQPSDEPILKGGAYYCGCDYVRGSSHCEHHGDPVEKFPETVKPDPILIP